MKTVSNSSLPFYINCKEGFLKFAVSKQGDALAGISFLGHTRNLRAATPLYANEATAIFIAKQLIRMPSVSSAQYFVLVQPALINFNKEREILA